jgi:crotonobetainyl-CoA:carnitine CoA-transferase CaiB-like acyl-CoA transferase
VYLCEGDDNWLAVSVGDDDEWAAMCAVMGSPDLATDERFADHASLLKNGPEAVAALDTVFASATLEHWREVLESFTGQWAVVQDTLEAAVDPQTVANGYLQECHTASGAPFQLVAAPVQYDEQPAVPSRAPEFNEHGDEILAALGLDWEAVVDLKVRGIVT